MMTKTADSELFICVTLCTRKRPIMLEKCLRSLQQQVMPDGRDYCVVVVDNDRDESARATVSDFQERAPGRFHYICEPEPGIPFARNRGMEKALDLGAEWIATIDDDEIASATWLYEYCIAIEKFPAKSYRGPAFLQYPADTPSWVPRKQKEVRTTGQPAKTMSTCNSLFNRSLVAEDGLALRFDEALRYTGGSDTVFFRTAERLGAPTLSVAEAVVYESVPEDRTTFKWLYERQKRYAANVVQRRSQNGLDDAVETIPKTLLIVVRALVVAICSIPIFLVSTRIARQNWFSAAMSVARAHGLIAARFKRAPEPYRNIEGH